MSSVLQIEDLQFIIIPIVGLGIVIRYGKIYFATFSKETTLLRDFFLLRYFPLLRYHPLSRICPLLKDCPLWRLFLSWGHTLSGGCLPLRWEIFLNIEFSKDFSLERPHLWEYLLCPFKRLPDLKKRLHFSRAHAFARSPSIKISPAQEITLSKDRPLKRLPPLNWSPFSISSSSGITPVTKKSIFWETDLNF